MTRWLVFAIFLAACGSPPAPDQLVVLVRHAEKAAEPASDPMLTEAGAERAEALAVHLAGTGVEFVITTQFHRTVDTGAPTAQALGIVPTVVAATRDGDHIQATADAVRAAAGTVLVVGHSNTIPSIIEALGGPALADLNDREYDTLFVLSIGRDRARLVTARYGAPDGFD